MKGEKIRVVKMMVEKTRRRVHQKSALHETTALRLLRSFMGMILFGLLLVIDHFWINE